MKKITFLLFFAFILNSNEGFSYLKKNKVNFPNKHSSVSSTSVSERGLEIRYYVFEKKPASLPGEITIDKVKYPLYKSKEDAIQAITSASIKKDYTVVYVISDKNKTPEIVTIAD